MHLFFEPSFGSSPPLIPIPSFVLSIVMLLIDAVVVSLIHPYMSLSHHGWCLSFVSVEIECRPFVCVLTEGIEVLQPLILCQLYLPRKWV